MYAIIKQIWLILYEKHINGLSEQIVDGNKLNIYDDISKMNIQTEDIDLYSSINSENTLFISRESYAHVFKTLTRKKHK